MVSLKPGSDGAGEGEGDGDAEVATAKTVPMAGCQNLVVPQVVNVLAPPSKTYTPYAEETESLWKTSVEGIHVDR